LGCNGYEITDLGVMVSAERILETAQRIGADIIGLSGLITPSLDEMVFVAREMKRLGISTPLLIGGATTSKAHTAVKIEPELEGGVVHVLDASRAVTVAQKLLSSERGAYTQSIQTEYAALRQARKERTVRLLSLEQARANAPKLTHNPVRPSFLGVKTLEYSLAELRTYIDWTPFFLAWELKGRYPHIFEDAALGTEAKKLFADAQVMLGVLEPRLLARAKIGFWQANSDQERIVVHNPHASGTTDSANGLQHTEWSGFATLRQQREQPTPNIALADYLSPVSSGVPDYLGAFACCIHGAEEIAKQYEQEHDDYNAILVKALADRLAEALAEKLHQDVRRKHWGYAPLENLENDDLIKERYAGIRPAPGYPAQPDHTEKRTIFGLLQAQDIGMNLTESCAMTPPSSVSGLYFAHEAARYFAVGKIGQDQLETYAAQKAMPLEDARRWLAPILTE
jgi:5-methyltetrahydrofolate--homocysteine methyltransferase